MAQRCWCPACRDPVEELQAEQNRGLCPFCFVHCPQDYRLEGKTAPFERQLARALASIGRWRSHVVKASADEDGLDPVAFHRLVSRPRAPRPVWAVRWRGRAHRAEVLRFDLALGEVWLEERAPLFGPAFYRLEELDAVEGAGPEVAAYLEDVTLRTMFRMRCEEDDER
jgi:hypothetical protein